ncbi:MAG: HNH endonuclease signature motif containing protein [Janthinobacterium lividum]
MKRSFWTDAQLTMLRNLYPDLRGADVAARIGRDIGSVHQKAGKLGLKKSEAFKASDLSGRVTRAHQHPSMIASRIQPGATPWNKGQHYVAGGRSAETRFKAGRPAQEARNYLPIGSLRPSAKDGYLERKLSDDPAIAPARRWVAVHRLVWMEAHGEIPAGHIVAFRPGMRTAVLDEITVDRLECISRAENARRNHPRSKSPELARLVQLKGAITRQVNRITREAQETSP